MENMFEGRRASTLVGWSAKATKISCTWSAYVRRVPIIIIIIVRLVHEVGIIVRRDAEVVY